MRTRTRTVEGRKVRTLFNYTVSRDYIDPTSGIHYPTGYGRSGSIKGIVDLPFPTGLKPVGDCIQLSFPMPMDNYYAIGYKTEYMSDDPSRGVSGLFKEVDHYKIEIGSNASSDNCDGILLIGNDADMFHTHTNVYFEHIPLLAMATYTLNDQLPSYLFGWEAPEGIQGALDVAFRSMRPSSAELTDDANLLLFLAELKDFRELAHLCRHRSKLVDVLRSMANFEDLTPKGLFKKVAKLSAEARLTTEYAIKPFINDVIALHSAFTKLDRRIAGWNNLAATGKYQTRHYDMTPLLQDAYSWPAPDQQLNSLIRVTSSHKVEAHAMLRFRPLPVDASNWSGMRKYHDAIGAGKPLSLAWELVPFSFLVDYIVNIGDFVKQFDTSLMNLPMGDTEFGYSLKWAIHQTCEARLMSSYAKCDAHLSKYVRRTSQVPDWDLEPWRRVPTDVLRVKLPSQEQFKNILALIVARLT